MLFSGEFWEDSEDVAFSEVNAGGCWVRRVGVAACLQGEFLHVVSEACAAEAEDFHGFSCTYPLGWRCADRVAATCAVGRVNVRL